MNKQMQLQATIVPQRWVIIINEESATEVSNMKHMCRVLEALWQLRALAVFTMDSYPLFSGMCLSSPYSSPYMSRSDRPCSNTGRWPHRSCTIHDILQQHRIVITEDMQLAKMRLISLGFCTGLTTMNGEEICQVSQFLPGNCHSCVRICHLFTTWANQVKKLQTWQHLVLGGFSGAVAASATMPLDVTKTALQCGNGHSIHQILGDIVKEKGFAGLFAGMVHPPPCLPWSLPMSCSHVAFPAEEQGRRTDQHTTAYVAWLICPARSYCWLSWLHCVAGPQSCSDSPSGCSIFHPVWGLESSAKAHEDGRWPIHVTKALAQASWACMEAPVCFPVILRRWIYTLHICDDSTQNISNVSMWHACIEMYILVRRFIASLMRASRYKQVYCCPSRQTRSPQIPALTDLCTWSLFYHCCFEHLYQSQWGDCADYLMHHHLLGMQTVLVSGQPLSRIGCM